MASQSDGRRGGSRVPDRSATHRASGESTADRLRLRVVSEQNDHGALTTMDPRTGATYHVVHYASPELREEADRLERGTEVELRLSRAGYRANVWRVEALSVPTG